MSHARRTTCADPRATAELPASGGRGAAKLAWVVTADGLRHVSTYAHLTPHERPAALCPACDRAVRLKLGARVVHHAAHTPGDLCAVTRPETALHFNLKCHIAAELERAIGAGAALRVTERCMVGQSGLPWSRRIDAPAPDEYLRDEWLAEPCGQRRDRLWIEGWDGVALERRVGDERGARVPDVVLYQGDRTVAAIEVFHSHAVDAAKAEVLAGLGIPWVEVRAEESLHAGDSPWTVAKALPVHRIGSSSPWRCDYHEELRQSLLRSEAVAAEREAQAREAARHKRRTVSIRLVDLLYPSGKVYRNVYRVLEESTDGVAHGVMLTRNEETLLALRLDSGPKAELWRRLKGRYHADVVAIVGRTGALSDSPMEWVRGEDAERVDRLLFMRDWTKVPMEDVFPLRWRFARQRQQWFLPKDLKEVRWEVLSAPLAPVIVAPRPTTRAAPVGIASPTPRWRRPLGREDLGPAVVAASVLQGALLFELKRSSNGAERVVLIPREHRNVGDMLAADEIVVANRLERIWLCIAGEWSRRVVHLPWLPVVEHRGQQPGVSVRGLSVPVSAAVEAFASGDAAIDDEIRAARALAMTLSD